MSELTLAQVRATAKRGGWLKYIRREADERAALNGCYFDVAAADHVCTFFRRFLRHSKGAWAGKPFEVLDWQREEIIYPIFGWKRRDGTRRFRKVYIEIPKKNGKSTLAAGIGLYMLCGDRESGADVYSAAVDETQALIVHGEAMNMVEASPGLGAYLNINRSTNTISFKSALSKYQALSKDAANKEGLNAHAIIADELHAWYGRKLWDALRYAFRARRQGLLFAITTAGDDMQSVCGDEHTYAEGVTAGTIHDDRYFGLIYAAKPDDDLTDIAVARRANPSMGITINEEEFLADVREAKQSPSSMAAMKRYSFNIWTSSSNPAIRLEDWKACEQSYTAKDLEGRECYAALDLGQINDMSSLVLLFPDGEDAPAESDGRTGEAKPENDAEKSQAEREAAQAVNRALRFRMRFRSLAFFWLPEAAAFDPRNVNGRIYQGWFESGHLIKTPGNEVDFSMIHSQIVAVNKIYRIRSLCYDPMFATQLTQELEEEGINRIPFEQNIKSYAPACVAFEKAVIGHRFGHHNHPILSWNVQNLAFWQNSAGYKRPIKPANNGSKKIDGAVAAIMASGGAMIDSPTIDDGWGGKIEFV